MRPHLLCQASPVSLRLLDAGTVQQGADRVGPALVVGAQVDEVADFEFVDEDASILFGRSDGASRPEHTACSATSWLSVAGQGPLEYRRLRAHIPGLMPGTLSARSRELRTLFKAFRYCNMCAAASGLTPCRQSKEQCFCLKDLT